MPGTEILWFLHSFSATHWFLHSFSWIVTVNVGRSCQKMQNCRPLTSGETDRPCTNMQYQEVLVSNQVGGSGRQRRKNDVCRQRIALVLRAPGMHSGHEVGAAAVESSCCRFISCPGTWTESRRCGDIWQKSYTSMEPGGKRYYSGKEKSLQLTRPGFGTDPNLLCIRGAQKYECPQYSRWKNLKCNLGRISDIIWTK